MICDVCGVGIREERLVRYSLSVDDSLIVIDHVPASVCPHCGETSFSPDVVESLQHTVWRKKKPARVIETAVYEFAS